LAVRPLQSALNPSDRSGKRSTAGILQLERLHFQAISQGVVRREKVKTIRKNPGRLSFGY
jgi:hypothetical protein